MVETWRTSFDWRTQEARMNAYPGFRTEIDGQTIHFLHVRSRHAGGHPAAAGAHLPGSFADFLDVIDPLVDPEAHGGSAADAFHLVIPSLPGMGFSTPLADGDWTMGRSARAFDTLMRRLGYDAYGAHGSDGGAMVSRELAMLAPDGFLGAHVLQLFSFPSGDPAEFERMSAADYGALEFAGWFQSVNGFADLNAKRPLTIAAALSDSPVGMLAYHELFENFGNGTSPADPRAGAHPGQPAVADQHRRRGDPVPLHGEGRSSRGSTTVRSGSPCSPTTSARSARSPSATTPPSCPGPSTRAAVTSRPWRCPRSSSASSGTSSAGGAPQ